MLRPSRASFLALAAAAVFLSACSKSPSTGASLDSAFRSAISPDAQTVVFIQLDRLEKSSLYQSHKQLLDVPRFDELVQRTGLDPRRDISSLCLVWDGKHMLLLAKGNFQNEQLENKLVSNGAQRSSYKDSTLFVHGSDAVAFPKPGFAVASSNGALETELNLIAAGSGEMPDEFRPRLAEVATGSQIWIVSRGGLPFLNFPMRSDLESGLSNFANFVTGTSVGVRLDDGSHLLTRVTCKSPEGAQRVNDAVRGLVGLARLSTKDDQLDMLRLWDAVSIAKDANVIRIQADLPADLSGKLIDQVLNMRGRAGAVLNRP